VLTPLLFKSALRQKTTVSPASMSLPRVEQRPVSGYLLVLAAYLGSTAAGAIVLHLSPLDWHPLIAMAAADVAATVAIFLVSAACNNTSIYDPYWSVAPVVLSLWLALGPGDDGFATRQTLVCLLVAAYGLRLTYNWVQGWGGLKFEDWRYVTFRKLGTGYWVMSLLGLHLFPTVMVLLGLLPLHAALVTGHGPLTALDAVAAAVTLTAIVIEAVADEQLRSFRRAKTHEGEICAVGLWSWSRHPNYFGEVLFWVGLWLFGVAAGAPAWAACGWVAMLALFLGYSIPAAEKRSLERRQGYAEHQRRVSRFLLWPPAA
jgi:steroid 5-alpha reductase family enzyme